MGESNHLFLWSSFETILGPFVCASSKSVSYAKSTCGSLWKLFVEYWLSDWSVTQYGNFAKPLDSRYWTMCWMVYLFVCLLKKKVNPFVFLFSLKRDKRILVELHVISSLTKLGHVRLMNYMSHLGYNWVRVWHLEHKCLLRVGIENLTFTRQGWKPWSYVDPTLWQILKRGQ